MLEKPLTDRVDPENVRTASGLDCAATGMQGWRVEMEVAALNDFYFHIILGFARDL